MSSQALAFHDVIRKAPKQLSLQLPQPREAGEHAEDLTSAFPISAGALPEADAAIALIGEWVRARTS